MKPYQTKVWTTADGEDIPLADMTPTHRRNALTWALRRAPEIEAQATVQELQYLMRPVPTVVGEMPGGVPILGPSVNMMPRGEMAQDAFDAMLEDRGRNPRAFVMGLPLIQELARLVALDSVATNEAAIET